MRNIVTSIIVLLILGCQNPSEKLIQENNSLIQKNESLKNRHQSVSINNSKLQKENNNLKKAISVLDFSTKIITTDTLPKILYENLVYKEDNLSSDNTDYQFLYHLSLFANPNRNITNKFETDGSIKDVLSFASYTGNYDYYIHYLWKSIDRSPENIKYYFNKNKELAYILLKKGNSYESSGFKNTIKTLLLSYEEIGKQKKLLNDLYSRTNSIGVLSDTIYNSIVTDKMNKLISEFRDSDFISYKQWAYSFWSRRNQEKNAEVVYQLIKEFDTEMNSYKFVEETEEDYYEDGF